jgi:hypothetical protein
MIEIVKEGAGKRYYEKTETADSLVNFFPTGKVFYEVENRLLMLKIAIKEAGLEDKVEILFEPDLYQKDGLCAIVKFIKKRHPHARLHGLLGTDEGACYCTIFMTRLWLSLLWFYAEIVYQVLRFERALKT